jgi:hypothetical protein
MMATAANSSPKTEAIKDGIHHANRLPVASGDASDFR